MEKKCFGAIDIGSNAVRLLIKKVDQKESGEEKLTKVLLLLRSASSGIRCFRKRRNLED